MLTIPLLLLALAVSLDSFTVGFTYGLRKMSIPFFSIAIIALCSTATLAIAILIGHVLESIVSVQTADKIGGGVLILLGLWVLIQFFREDKASDQLPHEKTIVNLEIKSLGIVIQILKKPLSADFDRSGTITGIEAFMLGIALSLDAFGAGIGAAMLDFEISVLAGLVAAMSFSFLYIGLKLGSIVSHKSWLQKFTFIPGILLIIIGIWKF